MRCVIWAAAAALTVATLAGCADDGAGVRDERPAPATTSPAGGY
jgi:hypothetical protein